MANLPIPLTEGLTEKQIAFAFEYVRLGGRNAAAAGVAAGYSIAGDGHRAVVSRLLRNQRVLALIRHLVMTDVQAEAVASMDTLARLRDDLNCPPAVRRQCANDILGHAGYLIEKFSTVHHVVSDERRSDAADLAELVNIVLGLDCGVGIVDQAKWDRAQEKARDARRGSRPTVIDAEFEPMPLSERDDARDDTADSGAGLEDVV
jgi:hypothetical protein